MERLRSFLESSTIHGLGYISTTRSFARAFWVFVVISGFTGAGVLIYQSFKSWADSPIVTTIENLPIEKFTFPKVTVCPLKNTYTDVNYDIMKAGNVNLDEMTRNELANYVMSVLEDDKYDKMMTNINNLQVPDKYYDWYHGYRNVKLPYKAPPFIGNTDKNKSIKTNLFILFF